MKKGTKVGLVAFVILVGLVLTFIWKSRKPEEGPTFRENRVETGDIRITIRATGVVQPVNRLEIKPPIAGRVEAVLVQEGQNVKKGQILAWMSSTERAAVLDAARAKGKEELSRWEELYRPTAILSPMNGTVILRSAEPGQSFTANDAILVLSDRLTVKAQVDETDLAQVKVGLLSQFSLDAYPNDKVNAKVMRIAYEAKTVNNVTMYEVDVTPLEAFPLMRSGMTATVYFDVASKLGVLVVSNDALRSENGQNRVLVKTEKGPPREVSVELGLTDGRFTEVLSGLQEGDVVLAPVLSPTSKQSEGANPFMPSRPKKGGPRP